MIEIVSRWDKTKVLYRAENAADVCAAVVEAVKSGADLSGAYLSRADLSRADLSGADLSRADLSRADLSRADLSRADLSRAYLSGTYLSRADLSGTDLSGAYLSGTYLSGADLSGTDLSRADLSGAYLSGTDLSGAYLSRADLSGTDLSGAYLSRTDLSRADLSGAYLSGTDLSGAYLSRADLSGTDLSGAYLSRTDLSRALDPVRADIWSILDQMPAEVPALEQAIQDGKIDGSVYSRNGCACLVGTLALAAGWGGEEESSIGAWCEDHVANLEPDGSRPAEGWFALIKPGDTPDPKALEPLIPPQDGWVSKEQWDKLVAKAGELKFSEGVYRATVALGWISEWRESREALVKTLITAGIGA